MKLGFTGTRNGMTDDQLDAFTELLKELHEREMIEEFHHGDCVGADAEAHDEVAIRIGPEIPHIHPPKDTKGRAYCVAVPDQIYEPGDYLVRDHDIVDAADIMIAAPKGFSELRRSGTWATVRYARKNQKTIYIVWPNGVVSMEVGNGK